MTAEVITVEAWLVWGPPALTAVVALGGLILQWRRHRRSVQQAAEAAAARAHRKAVEDLANGRSTLLEAQQEFQQNLMQRLEVLDRSLADCEVRYRDCEGRNLALQLKVTRLEARVLKIENGHVRPGPTGT